MLSLFEHGPLVVEVEVDGLHGNAGSLGDLLERCREWYSTVLGLEVDIEFVEEAMVLPGTCSRSPIPHSWPR
jgi:hypothetical protein